MPSTRAIIGACSCCGTMGGVHKLKEEQGGEAIFRQRNYLMQKKERKEREATDLIESDQLFGVAEYLSHCTVIV